MNGSGPMTAGRNGAGVLDLKRNFQSAWIYRLVCMVIGVVFIWSGITKLMAPKEFSVIIESYGLIPDAWILPLATALPLLEMVFGLGLLLEIRGSLAVITGLLMLFMAILSYGIWLGLDVDCGCFGPQDPESEAFHSLRPALYRDFVMIAGVVYLYFWRFYRSIKPTRLLSFLNSLFHKGVLLMNTIKKIVTFTVLGLLVLGLSTPVMAKNKFEKELETEQGAVKLVREVQRGGYDVVTTEELKQWIDSGKDMLIIDTMPYEASYKKVHVPGAKQFLFPIPDMQTWDTKETDGKSKEDFEALLGPDKNKTIVIYCGFVKCTRSHNGAAWAVKLGYKNVYRYSGGIFAWKGAKYPTEKVK